MLSNEGNSISLPMPDTSHYTAGLCSIALQKPAIIQLASAQKTTKSKFENKKNKYHGQKRVDRGFLLLAVLFHFSNATMKVVLYIRIHIRHKDCL
jgi:hypothetical protein